jgi:shikimate 5-dehydrogenase
MKNENKSKLSRRNFLLAVGAGGAATAAAIATQAVGPASAQPATSNNDKRRGRGYQETDHVRSYYNTAKV